MNWLLILIIAVFALYAWSGWRRGMIMIVMSFAAMIGSVVVTSAAAPALSSYVMDNTAIYETIRKNTYDSLKSRGVVSQAIESAGEEAGISDAGSIDISELGGEFDDFIEEVIQQLPLPEAVRDKAASAAIGGTISGSVNNTASKLEDAITGFVAVRIAGMIISSACYIIVFAAVYVVIRLLLRLANGISRLPLIKEVNKTLGILFGIIKALLIVWLFFVAVAVLYNTAFSQAVMTCVNDNAFLAWLYNNNIIMNILVGTVMG